MPDPQSPQPNPFAPPKAEVADVGPGTGFEYAGRGVRLGAALLDGLFFMLIVYLPAMLMVIVTVGASAVRFQPGMSAVQLLTALSGGFIAGFIGLVVWAWITIVLVSRYGQTMAKRLLGIKVVRKDGSPAALSRIFWLRNVVNTLIAMVPLVGGIYSLIDALMIFSETRQCIHDRLADTIVIRA